MKMPAILHIYYRILLKSGIAPPKTINKIIGKINKSGSFDAMDDKKIENILAKELNSIVDAVDADIQKIFDVFKKEAVKEESVLCKYNIKYIRTTDLGYNEHLPPFIYFTGNLNINSLQRGNAGNGRIKKSIFITSSRYKGNKIYKLNKNAAISFQLFLNGMFNGFDEDLLFFTGLSSEAEKAIIKSRMPELKNRLILLPHESLLSYAKNSPARSSSFSSVPAISIIDPFTAHSKYAFAMRNKLALAVSDELLVVYLSKKSSLAGLIENFKNKGKRVTVINNGDADMAGEPNATGAAAGERVVNNINANIMKGAGKTDNATLPRAESKGFEFSDNERAIIKYLDTGKVYIDNLINLSNISSSEVLQTVSLLELKGIIKRLPGGLIRLNETVSEINIP